MEESAKRSVQTARPAWSKREVELVRRFEALIPSELESEPCTTDHVRAGSEQNSGLHWSPPKSVPIQDIRVKEHFRSNGCGQFWQRRQEREERERRWQECHQSQDPKLSKEVVRRQRGNKGHLSTGCWSNPEETGVVQEDANKSEAQDNQRTVRAKEHALWNKVTKLQLWNNSRIRLLRALWTWHRLRHLTGRRTWIPKIG